MKNALLLFALTMPQLASADVVINIFEQDNNVNLELLGSINIDATDSFIGDATLLSNGGYHPDFNSISTGPVNSHSDAYSIDTPTWASMGSSEFTWDSTSGDAFGILTVDIFDGEITALLILPTFYVSGGELNSSAVKFNSTTDSLGLHAGVYTTSFSNGSTTETITVNIIPTPSTLALLGLGGLLTTRKRR